MSQITASIVLYNTPESQLVRLLECIEHSSISVLTYLVDNSPTALDYSCFHRPSIIYLRADKNNGYGAGHNIALRKILGSADFHFVLNPDIYFGPKELEQMVRFMRSDSTIGLLMPKVIYPDGRLQYLCKLLPTPVELFLRRFALGPLREIATKREERFELRHSGYNAVMDVPYLSGCFMLFRVSALREIGLFDERFFMYPEDIDISRRMHACYRTVFFPLAVVVHDHARDSYKKMAALGVHVWNIVKYFNKWGWLWDSERTRVNREIVERLHPLLKSKAQFEENTDSGKTFPNISDLPDDD